MKIIVVALLFVAGLGCSFHTGPSEPSVPNESSCEAACVHLDELGCYAKDECLADLCELVQDERTVTGKTTPLGCLEHAKSCAEAERCK